LKELHDTCSYLATVCDDDVAAKIRQQVDDIDERWRAVQRALAEQSVDQYNAGVQHVSCWCDMVKTELSRHVTASCDNLNAQNNSLTVSAVCLLSLYPKIQPSHS